MKNTMRKARLTKLALFLAMFALVALIGFTFVSCDDGGGGPGGDYYSGGGGYDGGGGVNTGGSWPSNSILSKYGISGLRAPSGATNIGWGESYNEGVVIWFDGPSSAHQAMHSYFTNNGWDTIYQSYDGSYYTKGSYAAMVSSSGNTCTIVAVRD